VGGEMQCIFDPSVPSPGSQGATCDTSGACRSGICEDRICVNPCDPAGPACPDPFACGPSQVAPGQNVCRGESLTGGGGFCAEAPAGGRRGGGPGLPAGLGALGLLAVAAGLRRRRGRTR
jgi:hypothetical protein